MMGIGKWTIGGWIMRILITNDDGIMSEGIYALAKELEKDNDVTIVAPEAQRSAQSHAITLNKPLVVKEVKLEGLKSKAYSISGTPADCVRASMEMLVDEKIDMVFSGINMGLNSGMDILYSGTVSAAIEANIFNKPAIAISAELIDGKINYEIAAKLARKVLEETKDYLLKTNMVLNINTPFELDDIEKEIKICKIGGVIYDYYYMDTNENGEKVLKLKGRKESKLVEGTDRYYLSKGYATLTPLLYDLNNFELLEQVRDWFK